MTRYVIGPDAAIALAGQGARLRPSCQLLAPTLLRSQVLALLYARERGGQLTRREAERQLESVRRLNIRLLGDRVLQQRAWTLAAGLGWQDTFVAEYVALTQLQADALVTTDDTLRSALAGVVPVASIGDLLP